jgi:hypothetical protein
MPDMRLAHVHPLRWLGQRDRGFAALRRATRTAIIMPGMFALGDKVIGNSQLATFAAFGSFAMLLLVDFGGPMAERLQAEAALVVTGGVFVCLATLASQTAWLAAVAMAVAGFGVIFAGVVSSVLAGATTALLLAFILPVSLAAPASAVPDRLAGWGMAGGVALVATALLWPPPQRATGCVAPRPPPAGHWPPGCARGSRTCSAAWTNNLRWIAITRLRRRTRQSRRCAVHSWRRPTAQPG